MSGSTGIHMSSGSSNGTGLNLARPLPRRTGIAVPNGRADRGSADAYAHPGCAGREAWDSGKIAARASAARLAGMPPLVQSLSATAIVVVALLALLATSTLPSQLKSGYSAFRVSSFAAQAAQIHTTRDPSSSGSHAEER